MSLGIRWGWLLCASLLGLVLGSGIVGAAEAEHPAVRELSQRGVLKGYPHGQFEPDKPVTRLELAVILARLVRAIEANPAAAQPASPPKPAAKPARLPGRPAWARSDFQFLADRGFAMRAAGSCRTCVSPHCRRMSRRALSGRWHLSPRATSAGRSGAAPIGAGSSALISRIPLGSLLSVRWAVGSWPGERWVRHGKGFRKQRVFARRGRGSAGAGATGIHCSVFLPALLLVIGVLQLHAASRPAVFVMTIEGAIGPPRRPTSTA